LDTLTPRQFHNRLNGWRQIRDADHLDAWRRTRTAASYTLSIGHWKEGKAPDIMHLMPLPGDPKAEPKFIEITDEEMARKKYKAKKALGLKFSEEFELLVRQHYQPDWGPHPDEL
jgi:hypothetical protein